ncbi:MAG: putative Ig domain-containing protein [Promethearchaeota archaeon]
MHEDKILTPPIGPEPRINGPKVFGVKPNSLVLIKVPATGVKPLHYSIKNLPQGLSLDSRNGIIRGHLSETKTFSLQLTVSNSFGKSERTIKIIVGDIICLTPPMGWNSWYVYSLWVSQDKIERTAQAMHDSGLIDHGWSYVNIDDGWQGFRDMERTKALQPNPKFPDMGAMCEKIHNLGLKVGIYSTPWVGSYAGYIGGSIPNANSDFSKWIVPDKRRLEKNQLFGNPIWRRKKLWFFGQDMSRHDVAQWAEWGIDLLKYDWNPNDKVHIIQMGEYLHDCGRDMVYSLSNTIPFRVAQKNLPYVNLWRTTWDIMDYWIVMGWIGFHQQKWTHLTRPGHWNDPDMLQFGMTAHPHKPTPKFFPSHLSPDAQYTQMSLWSLLSAPLLLSCDLEQLDPFTLNLLTNDEVIEINQDSLGNPAIRLERKIVPRTEAWAKRLEDNSIAVGFFNRSLTKRRIRLPFSKLGYTISNNSNNDKSNTDSYGVRDVWRQEFLGSFQHEFSVLVDSHGVKLLKLTKIDEN